MVWSFILAQNQSRRVGQSGFDWFTYNKLLFITKFHLFKSLLVIAFVETVGK
jgi:hypothetical protein